MANIKGIGETVIYSHIFISSESKFLVILRAKNNIEQPVLEGFSMVVVCASSLFLFTVAIERPSSTFNAESVLYNITMFLLAILLSDETFKNKI